jgi:alpha-amylase/alpha-mannosidase (GH57 family)
MPDIYITFVWHMHQPFYKDLATGEYQLPWTRLHALKDYYGMVKILGGFPQVHQTFNLVPSMVVQIQDYASGHAVDPFLRVALKPAEDLTPSEQGFLLRYFFQAHPVNMIRRFPRYGELYDAWHHADRNPLRARPFFPPSALRDLQVISQVAWFEEEFLAEDPEIRELAEKERGYSRQDQETMGRKQIEMISRVMPVYREFAASGQIEISTTPFYHPILPLLCDSAIASESHPDVPLPPRFSYPGDAEHQLRTAREYIEREFGFAPTGLWPSEGSVSDAALTIAADTGFRWAATDNGVLARTLHHAPTPAITYRPYRWEQNGRALSMLFRDHELSDLVGFVYSKMQAAEAASHFLHRIRENCAPILASGRDALVPVILDGENAWEYYDKNGRPFLAELYGSITNASGIQAVTVSEALERIPAQPLTRIFPGSWINANFDVWIGAEEDNRAWDMLLRARQSYDEAVAHGDITEDNRKLAFEELLISEGSDWCWWYGPEHYTENRAEFDALYRSHLANVYRAIGKNPPDDLARPIIKTTVVGHHQTPSTYLKPVIDGEVTSFFEWMGAGRYRVDARSGAMHGRRTVVRQLMYGTDRETLYLRLDFDVTQPDLRVQIVFPLAQFSVLVADLPIAAGGFRAALGKVCEIAIPLAQISAAASENVRMKVSIWQGALPLDSLPQEGWIELAVGDPPEWPV